MSTELDTLESTYNNDVHVTSFSGGAVRGPCLQLTQQIKLSEQTSSCHSHSYVQLDEDQAEQLIGELMEWLGRHDE